MIYIAAQHKPTPITERSYKFTTRDGCAWACRWFEGTSSIGLIFLHGIEEDMTYIQQLAALLAGRHGIHVLVPALRGYERTEAEPCDVTYIGQYEDDLEDLLSGLSLVPELAVIRWWAGGHSMGVGTFWRYLTDRSKATRSLVQGVVGVAPFLHPALPVFRSGFGQSDDTKQDDTKQDGSNSVKAIYQLRTRLTFLLYFLHRFGIRRLHTAPVLTILREVAEGDGRRRRFTFRMLLARLIEETTVRQLTGRKQPPNSNALSIPDGLPIWIAIGEQDEMLEPAKLQAFWRTVPGTTIRLVAKADHNTILAQPEWLEELAAYMLGHRQSSEHEQDEHSG